MELPSPQDNVIRAQGNSLSTEYESQPVPVSQKHSQPPTQKMYVPIIVMFCIVILVLVLVLIMDIVLYFSMRKFIDDGNSPDTYRLSSTGVGVTAMILSYGLLPATMLLMFVPCIMLFYYRIYPLGTSNYVLLIIIILVSLGIMIVNILMAMKINVDGQSVVMYIISSMATAGIVAASFITLIFSMTRGRLSDDKGTGGYWQLNNIFRSE